MQLRRKPHHYGGGNELQAIYEDVSIGGEQVISLKGKEMMNEWEMSWGAKGKSTLWL